MSQSDDSSGEPRPVLGNLDFAHAIGEASPPWRRRLIAGMLLIALLGALGAGIVFATQNTRNTGATVLRDSVSLIEERHGQYCRVHAAIEQAGASHAPAVTPVGPKVPFILSPSCHKVAVWTPNTDGIDFEDLAALCAKGRGDHDETFHSVIQDVDFGARPQLLVDRNLAPHCASTLLDVVRGLEYLAVWTTREDVHANVTGTTGVWEGRLRGTVSLYRLSDGANVGHVAVEGSMPPVAAIEVLYLKRNAGDGPTQEDVERAVQAEVDTMRTKAITAAFAARGVDFRF